VLVARLGIEPLIQKVSCDERDWESIAYASVYMSIYLWHRLQACVLLFFCAQFLGNISKALSSLPPSVLEPVHIYLSAQACSSFLSCPQFLGNISKARSSLPPSVFLPDLLPIFSCLLVFSVCVFSSSATSPRPSRRCPFRYSYPTCYPSETVLILFCVCPQFLGNISKALSSLPPSVFLPDLTSSGDPWTSNADPFTPSAAALSPHSLFLDTTILALHRLPASPNSTSTPTSTTQLGAAASTAASTTKLGAAASTAASTTKLGAAASTPASTTKLGGAAATDSTTRLPGVYVADIRLTLIDTRVQVLGAGAVDSSLQQVCAMRMRTVLGIAIMCMWLCCCCYTLHSAHAR